MKRIFAMLLAAVLLLGVVGCGGSEQGATAEPGVELSGVYDSVAGQLPSMMLMDADSMMNFYGVDAALCEQFVMAICADGLRADEVWLLEAKDAASLAELKEMAESRLAAKEGETINYLPDQYEIVKEAELYTKGRVLVFIVSPEVDAIKSAVDAAIG